MGANNSRTDYDWSYTEEPHRSRRDKILAKHPEIKELMTVDHSLKYAVLAMIAMQITAAYLLRNCCYLTILAVAYCFGGVVNHSMTLAIHEISHGVAFGACKPQLNRALGMLGNVVMAVPYFTFFKKYHLEHHRYQGDDILDVDIPSKFEARLFTSAPRKLLWMFLQPMFYALRPLFINPKPVTRLEITNFLVIAIFDFLIYSTMGGKSLFYLAIGTFLGLGIHPVAGHFISEHYVFTKGFETYSYYGPLNMITFNVGYHNEHHDFPSIPGCNLPKVKEIAGEFYDDLPHHTSWCWVLYKFVTDPDIGPYARVKRHHQNSQKVVNNSNVLINGGNEILQTKTYTDGIGNNATLTQRNIPSVGEKTVMN